MMDAIGVKLPWWLRGFELWGPFSVRHLFNLSTHSCSYPFGFTDSFFFADYISLRRLYNLYSSYSILGLAIVVLCTIVLLVGVEESSILNMIMTAINIAVIIFIIVLGA